MATLNDARLGRYLLLFAMLLGGCSTSTQLLTLKRDSLVRIEAAERSVSQAANDQLFDPTRYDLYLHLNSTVFNEILEKFDNTVFQIPGDRPIDVTIRSVRLAFRPGYPDLRVSTAARDPRSGLQADVVLDAALVLEGDTRDPNSLYLRLVATEVVPNLRWGLFELTKWRFARRLLQLEATRFTERIPRIKLPLDSKFVLGSPAGQRTITIPTGGGYIRGNVTWPSTEIDGSIVIRHVLFLRNGVHFFGNVEGF